MFRLHSQDQFFMIHLDWIPPARLWLQKKPSSRVRLHHFRNPKAHWKSSLEETRPMFHRKTMENPWENPWFRDNSASCPSSVVARWGSPIWEWCLLRDLSMARLSFVHLAIRGPTAVLAAGARNGDFRHNDTISVFADSDLAEVSAVTSCLYPPWKL